MAEPSAGRGSGSREVTEERREQILQAALEVIVERGYADTRIADVAERAGTSPALVIYYFKTRDQLLTEAIRYSEDSWYAEYLRRMAQIPTAAGRLTLIQQVPQPVVARVHGLATAAGCQLVASADLAVASEDAGFAAPGGKGGWFCHTPMVAIARNIGRKRAAEMAMSGDVIDAGTALDWGLVNRVVPAAQLDTAVADLLDRVTRGSADSKGIGKQALYAQIDLDQPKAYAHAVEVMAATSQLPDAREGMRAFLGKRKPQWRRGRT
jgi:enoyl-CoA hydratase/carnithine racemase